MSEFKLNNKRTKTAEVDTESGKLSLVTAVNKEANIPEAKKNVEVKIEKIVAASYKMIAALRGMGSFNPNAQTQKIFDFYDKLKPAIAADDIDLDDVDQVLILKNAAILSGEIETIQRNIIESAFEAVYGVEFVVEKSIFSQLTKKMDNNENCDEAVVISKLPDALGELVFKIIQERSVRYGSI